eukprot:TRINITY_DN5518_c2_g1_i1.p2 TRINITY_DN5518_c2_g1~~TRINITY_DN5518_c2_g1_i1.p2  ORF type:complete len:125 (+),score=27.13 TRINITY_DN5518_c2_g1_i1:70-444(+)
MPTSYEFVEGWERNPPNVEECGAAIQILCKEVLSLRREVAHLRGIETPPPPLMPSYPRTSPTISTDHRYAPQARPPIRRDPPVRSSVDTTSLFDDSLSDKISSAVRASKRSKPEYRHYWSMKQP